MTKRRLAHLAIAALGVIACASDDADDGGGNQAVSGAEAGETTPDALASCKRDAEEIMAFILANQTCATDAECGLAGATVTLYLTETSAHCSRMVTVSADVASDVGAREARLRQDCADLLPDIALMGCASEPVVACEGGRCRILPL